MTMSDVLDPTALWGRRAVVTVGPQGQLGWSFDSLPHGDSFRIVFDVEKTLDRTTNKARVSIYGLSAVTAHGFDVNRDFLDLSAGFGENIEMIYHGDLATVHTERRGASMVTDLECSDGVRKIKEAKVAKTFPRGTPQVNIVADVAATIGDLKRDMLASISAAVADAKKNGITAALTKSFTASGPAATEMDRLGQKLGFKWSVQDGAVQVVPNGQPLPGTAVLLTPYTGLVGVPTRLAQTKGEDGKMQGFDGFKASFLLIPGVTPGALVAVSSTTLRGVGRVRKVHLSGDTRSGWFGGECEVEELPGVTALVPEWPVESPW